MLNFDRVELDPGETLTVALSLPATNFGFHKPRTGHVVESGTYHLRVADQTASFDVTDAE